MINIAQGTGNFGILEKTVWFCIDLVLEGCGGWLLFDMYWCIVELSSVLYGLIHIHWLHKLEYSLQPYYCAGSYKILTMRS